MADNKNTQATDVNEQIKVSIDKINNIKDSGKDPFKIKNYDVKHQTK